MLNLEKALEITEEIAMLAGKVLLQHLGKLEKVKEKSAAGDLVTEADNASEKVIFEKLKDQFPSHSFLGEEGGLFLQKSDFLWAIDPLDGTTNYTHEFPVFSISIALLHNMIPQLGIVYNPISKEVFKAVIGKGAYLNDSKIHVSKTKLLTKSLLATGFAYDRRDTPDNNYLEFCYLTSISHGVRRMGSAAIDLCYVASGRYDGFWERGLKIWDIAAGSLIVGEAKGRVSSYENGPIDLNSGRILATNNHIHKKLSETLIEVRKLNAPIIF